MLGNNIQLDSARKVQPHQDVVKDGETQIDENEHTLVVFQRFPGFMWVTTGPLIWESLLRNGCLLADHDKKQFQDPASSPEASCVDWKTQHESTKETAAKPNLKIYELTVAGGPI